MRLFEHQPPNNRNIATGQGRDAKKDRYIATAGLCRVVQKDRYIATA
jgi:hypothetical protein